MERNNDGPVRGRRWVSVGRQTLRRAWEDGLPDRAATLAYYGFLAIPAMSLLSVGLFGLSAGPQTIDTVLNHLRPVMPTEALALLRRGLTGLTSDASTPTTLVGVGAALAIWTVSGAMGALMRALNAIWRTPERRGFVRQRLVALALFAWLLLAVVLTAGFLVLGPKLSIWIGDAVGATHLIQVMWWTAQWPISIGGLVLAASAILRFAPDREPVGRWLSAGATTAAILWILASGGFALFVAQFGSYNQTWGPLATVAVTLTWLWFSALALLIGAQLDATRALASAG